MKRLLAYGVTVIVISTLIMGCSNDPYVVNPAVISSKVWVLKTINGITPVSRSAPVTIEFNAVNAQQGRVSGQGPCNRYYSGYKVEGKNVLFTTPIGSTMQVCPIPLLESEKDYLTALQGTKRITFKNGQLQLKDHLSAITLIYGQESGVVRVNITAQAESFPAGSQFIISLQEQGSEGVSSSIVGMSAIQLKDTHYGTVSFLVRYAPILVKPNRSYIINVRVDNKKGDLIYRNLGIDKVVLYHVG
ncbi:MAG: META domain-containing protein [Endozoicomonas sp. (ex Botrylloides leachii)]|nr:META domain-containing protein [Endozoicomonas sp. (ex Botrylloides leachii)]